MEEYEWHNLLRFLYSTEKTEGDLVKGLTENDEIKGHVDKLLKDFSKED